MYLILNVAGIFKDDGTSSETDLHAAVVDFNSTLANFGFNVVFQTFESVEGNIPLQLCMRAYLTPI